MRAAALFGQNSVDPDAYEGFYGVLRGCVPDARDLGIALSNSGFNASMWFSGCNVDGPKIPWEWTGNCTRKRWFDIHADLQSQSTADDIVVIGNSGHGMHYDTAWQWNAGEAMLFHDGYITDKELFSKCYSAWKPGVNVLYILDTCYSGGMADRDFLPYGIRTPPDKISRPIEMNMLEADEAKGDNIRANITIWSAADKGETAADGEHNGAFTGTLLSVWDLSHNDMSWQEWFNRTALVMANAFPKQHPQAKSFNSTDWLQRRVIV